MDKEYLTRLIFLESVAIDNLMKMRLDKMVVIPMESRQRAKSEKVKAGYMKQTNRL